MTLGAAGHPHPTHGKAPHNDQHRQPHPMIPRALFTIAVTSYAVKTGIERYTWRAIRRAVHNINGNPR